MAHTISTKHDWATRTDVAELENVLQKEIADSNLQTQQRINALQKEVADSNLQTQQRIDELRLDMEKNKNFLTALGPCLCRHHNYYLRLTHKILTLLRPPVKPLGGIRS